MSIVSIIIWLVLGAIIGWLAGIIMKSGGGLLNNIILGIVGSAVGGFIAKLLGIGLGKKLFGLPLSLPGLLISIAGACLVIFLFKLGKGKR